MSLDTEDLCSQASCKQGSEESEWNRPWLQSPEGLAETRRSLVGYGGTHHNHSTQEVES
jgi:hypothetical protein